ncbi:MAG: substrate-binding domain-containing protein [Paracoccaceae bacterium]
MTRFLAALLVLFGSFAHAEEMKLAVTTSFHNSGLSDILIPAITHDTGIEVQLLVVGTGQALRLGKAGDVDAILVHSRPSEDAFLEAGFAPHRREIMYNDFIFIGPVADPADVKGADSAAEALIRIERSKAVFVSRGDDSGTHKKELSLWTAAALDPVAFDGWYRAVGAGMGTALNTAAGMNAYIIADRASWLNFANKSDLALLYSGDPALFNQYAYLPISVERHSHVKSELALRLEDWLTSARAADLINGYEVGGETLFIFNASPSP